MDWTPDREERVAALWNDGKSATEVADAMGTTKGTIIGKVNRLRAAGTPLREGAETADQFRARTHPEEPEEAIMAKTEKPTVHRNEPSQDAMDAISMQKMMEAKKRAASEQGTMRAIYALAEKNGIHLKAAKRAIKIAESDKAGEALREMEETIRLARILQVEMPASQLDFIKQDPSLVGADNKAFEDGLRAGRLNIGTGDCPYEGNLEQQWLKGNEQGAAEYRAASDGWRKLEESAEPANEDDDGADPFPDDDDDQAAIEDAA